VNQLEHPVLSDWANFYVIVGSASAALISVQFVMITLVAAMRTRTTAESLGAFGTPTVVHFTGALIVSAILSAPWPSLVPASVALALCGVAGVAYSGLVFRRARRQTAYVPVWQDWLWFAVAPCSVYATLVVSTLFLRAAPRHALFVIGAAVLGLLLVAVHNAWDSVTHIVVSGQADSAPTE
jgi:hypothetical protein